MFFLPQPATATPQALETPHSVTTKVASALVLVTLVNKDAMDALTTTTTMNLVA